MALTHTRDGCRIRIGWLWSRVGQNEEYLAILLGILIHSGFRHESHKTAVLRASEDSSPSLEGGDVKYIQVPVRLTNCIATGSWVNTRVAKRGRRKEKEGGGELGLQGDQLKAV